MAGDLILITGVSGFLGYSILSHALETGFYVRGIVRNPAQIDIIKNVLPAELYTRTELVVVSDLAAAGAFDEVVKDVNYIIHVASPIGNISQDFEKDYFRPAVNITVNLLSAAAKVPTVKRIAITSSVSAYIPPADFAAGKLQKDVIRSDDDYLHYTGKEQFSHHLFAYAASKSLALDAADTFIKTRSPGFDLVFLVPSFVFGPSKIVGSAREFARGSNKLLLDHLLGNATGPLLTISVHIDDVARAHVEALKDSVPAGRYILDSEETNWSEAGEVVKKHFPASIGKTFPEHIDVQTIKVNLDGSKAESVFGFRFKSFAEQVKDTVEYYLSVVPK